MSFRIAFIGTGAIGLPMAGRLLDAGHALVVFDVRSEAALMLRARGAMFAGSAAEAATGADVVFTCLPSSEAIEMVYFGPQGVAGADCRPPIAIDLSTSGPDLAASVGKRLHAVGIEFVDAPVSGGVDRAVAGRLAIMVAGSAAAIDTAMPALAVLGSDIVRVGVDPGQAQVVKLINNVLSYAALTATSEALLVARKAGIELAVAVEALNSGTGRNSATATKIPENVFTRRFDYGAANRISHKDLSLYLSLARRLDVPTPITGLLFDLLERWIPGREDEDMTSIARLFESWAGAEILPGNAAHHQTLDASRA